MIAVAICLVLMTALQFATPYWWWIMIVPFGYGLWQSRSAWQSARVGMCSAGALWLAMSLWQWFSGGERLAERASGMLGLSNGALLIALSIVTAVIAAGVAGAGGYFIKTTARISETREAANVHS